MVDSNLIHYIRDAIARGHQEAQIKQTLTSHGWQEGDIRDAYALAQSPNYTPVATAPGLLKPSALDFYSPYSRLLAVVLFVTLLILSTKIIKDVRLNFPDDINARLTFDALLVLPFLIAASALHFFFHQRKEKFLILSQPYYLVAGWLMLRLLWNVSQYILDSNAVYGVYIVLVLVVVVLTAIIFFIQHFIKRKE